METNYYQEHGKEEQAEGCLLPSIIIIVCIAIVCIAGIVYNIVTLL